MNNDLAHKAVSAALDGNWELALSLNNEILESDQEDVDALNRLARAYAELGNTKKASEISQRVLDLDPFNTIASKCLSRWKELGNGKGLRSKCTDPCDFIEEPGKTKILTLINTGPDSLLATLDAGDEVKLNPHGHRISVVTSDGHYIGKLPDDIGAKLKQLIKHGNVYKVLIKSNDKNQLKVFIKEIKVADGLKDIPSFTHEKIDYISFTPPELVHKKESASTDELD